MHREIRKPIIDLAMKLSYFKYWLLSFLFAVFGGFQLYGQTKDNLMSIDDRIFPVYQNGLKHIVDSTVFVYKDSVIMLAKQYHDKKAEVLAYTLPLRYYFRQNDEEGMAKAVEECKFVARKNNFLQYFYYAYVEQCTMLVNKREYAKLKNILNDMRKWAHEDNNDYGLASCYIQLGHLARHTYNYNLAIDYYIRAIEFCERAEQPLSYIYLNLAACYGYLHEHDKAEMYFEKSYNASVDDNSRMAALIQEASYANIHRQFDKMEDLYNRVEQLKSTCGTPTNTNYIYLKLNHYLLNKQYDNYLKALDSIASPYDRLSYRQRYEVEVGNYKVAFILTDSMLKEAKKTSGTETQLVLSDLSNQMEMAQLEAENTKLELEQKEHEAKTNRMMLVFLSVITAIIIIVFVAYTRMRGRVITRLKRAWKHAIQEEQKAIVANNLKNDFIQNMSHEIRTPLNAIVGFSQMLSDPQMDGLISPEEKQEYGALIKANTNMMTSLVEDILSLSDIENGHYKMQTNEYCLNAMCQFSVDTTRIRCHKNVKMYYTSDVNDEYKVFTDSHRVQQVVMNMLTNSCKHTNEGEIHLHCAVNEPKERIIFSVTDTGKGVPPEMAEEIFERFKKLDTFVQGTGLGLSISRIIAELLEGRIYLDTTYTAGGARFVFEMKLHKVSPTPISTSNKTINSNQL